MSAAIALKPGALVRTESACRLVVDADPMADAATREQAQGLRGFVRRALLRQAPRLPGLRDVDLGEGPSLPWSQGPVEPAETIFVFDVASLLANQPLACHALLAPLSVSAALAQTWPGALDEEAGTGRLETLARLQQALRTAHGVTVFDSAQEGRLAQLGGVSVRGVPWPALAPAAPAPLRADLALVCHTNDRALVGAVRAALAAVLPVASLVEADATGLGPGRAPVAALVLPARIHVHVGSGRAALSSFRVVDSLAAGRPVVQLRPAQPLFSPAVPAALEPAAAHPAAEAAAAELATERQQMAVEPMRTGLVATTATEAADAVLRLMADIAAAEAFRRHADRAVEQFNRAVEDALFASSTTALRR